ARTPYLTAWANSGKSGRERALRLMAIQQARLEPLAVSVSGHERMVNGRAAARGEKRMDLSEEIAWFGNILNFGDILNMDGPLVEIGSRSVFVNSAVIRSIFSTCNALGQDGLPTLGMVQKRPFLGNTRDLSADLDRSRVGAGLREPRLTC